EHRPVFYIIPVSRQWIAIAAAAAAAAASFLPSVVLRGEVRFHGHGDGHARTAVNRLRGDGRSSPGLA
ncbi:hypothetical protein B296_00041570, partial [Ensete ventricosum]